MSLNENKPTRRVRGAGSTDKAAGAASGSVGKDQAKSQKKSSSVSKRDNKPQYRTRTKSATKADAKTFAKSALNHQTKTSSKPTLKGVSSRQVQTGKNKPVERQTGKINPVNSGLIGDNSTSVGAENPATSGSIGKSQPTARIAGQQENAQQKTDASPIVRSTGPLPQLANKAIGNGSLNGVFSSNGKTVTKRGNNETFADFFKRNIKVCLPALIAVVVLVFGGIADLATSFGRIHPGVKVGGVEVGGMTKEDAASELENALSTVLEDNRVTVYATEKIAKQDDATLLSYEEESDGVETANAAELSGTDVSGNGKSDKWTVTPSTVGAYVDGESMAEDAFLVGREGNFIVDRISAWFGRFDIDPQLGFNTDSFNSLADEINSSCGKKIKDSKIAVADGKASVTDGRDGLEVNSAKLSSMLNKAMFMNEDTKAFVAPMETTSMHIQPETAQRVADLVTETLAEDVVVTYDDESWTLDSAKLGEMLSQTVLSQDQYLKIGNGTQKKTKIPEKGSEEAKDFEISYDLSAGVDEASGYTLQCYVNQETFSDYLVSILGKKAQGGAKNAKFDTSSGDEVKIVKSKNGNGPDRNGAALLLQDILFGDVADRTIAMEDTVIEPELTTKEAEAMGVKEKLASWSIPLSGTSSRIKNIQLLCKLINNSLIEPGGTWSFNETTGERTEEKGFEKAAVIVNGKHEDQLGGGVCQVATCVFNAACYSGLGIVTRTNHDFYISAYDDEGFADATVSWEVPDFAFLNDTENYILLTADASGEDVVVTLWGTDDGRKVTCDRGEWKEGTKYKTIKENDPDLEKGTTKVEQVGVDGRSVKIHYLAVSKSGEVLHDIEFNSVYVPQNEIIKVGTKTSSSSDDSSSETSSDSE